MRRAPVARLRRVADTSGVRALFRSRQLVASSLALTLALLVAVAVTAAACRDGVSAPAPSSTSASNARLAALWDHAGDSYVLDLLRARADRAFPVAREAAVFDPVYKARKSFKGYALRDVMASLPVSARSLGAGWQVVFECADGYRAKLPIDAAIGTDDGLLAFADESAAISGWQPLKQGKQWLTPDPFYLVWQRDESKQRPWPYAILRIVVEPIAAEGTAAERTAGGASATIPGANADGAVERGRGIFAAQCAKCHSLNLHGGTLGPELNVPKNVTEYWQEAQLQAFIRNPSAFRAGSKMPAFEPIIGDRGIADVLAYLEAMRDHKTDLLH